MAEPEFGPPCPGCTPALISKRIEQFPEAYSTCRPCRDRGALYHAQVKPAWDRAMNDVVRDARDRKNGAGRG